MDIKKITGANRAAWNQATPVHQQARKMDLKKEFVRPGYSTLDDTITAILTKLDLKGKRVAQVCCNNGRETISLVNMGAESAVGFDISDAAIEEARELASIAGVDCRFVRTDAYDIGPEWRDKFDIVYISIGAISWMPNLDRFFEIVAGLLKPGAVLIMYEMHPFTYLFAEEQDPLFDPANPTKPVYSYFRKDPWVENTGIDYVGKTTYKSSPSYSYTQTMSQILSAIISSGMSIDELREFPHDISDLFAKVEEVGKMPLCYTLVASRTDGYRR